MIIRWRLVFIFILSGFASLFPGNIGARMPEETLPVLTKVIIDNDSLLYPDSRPKDYDIVFGNLIVLNQRDNNIGFEFADSGKYSYQYFLEGFEKKRPGWQNYHFKEYTNIPAGRYIFRVSVKKDNGELHELKPVTFRVLPFWYSSSPAIIIYCILFILAVWATYDQLKYRFARTQYMLEQLINTRTEELIIEKEKTDNLLSNVLPKNTADEIMAKGKATKIKYNFVTVLFSDIQGFTKIAEEMNPEVLIDELDKFFFHFDSVVEKYGIEKIKTIGDAYMCAGGIPEKNRTNPVEIILAALEMQQYMTKLKSSTEIEGMKFWDIRIGIHTGTVVAGVVGQKKLSYDIWGDTVNTASRMESSGEAGKINISGTTYEFVKEFFICEHRGKMPVKYKGEIDMYFVNGIVDGLCDESGDPNSRFFIKMQKIKLQDIEEAVTKLFDDEAPPNLYFHNALVMKGISNQVDLLANAEKLPEEDYIHLKLAAIFLFTGYISDYDNAPGASCRLVEELLPKYGFKKEDIAQTERLINNSFNSRSDTVTDHILSDSRFDYLGRVDYIRLTDKLMREETEYGKVSDMRSWIESQRKLLERYEFVTATARLLRGVSSEDQIVSLNDFARELK